MGFMAPSHWYLGPDRYKHRLLCHQSIRSTATCDSLYCICPLYQGWAAWLHVRDAIGKVDQKLPRADEFYSAMLHYLLIIATAVPLFALQDFVEARLVLAWRAALTDALLAAFFRGPAFFRVVHTAGVDNPDQRISQDVATFVATSTMLGFGVVQKASNCAAFVGVPLSGSLARHYRGGVARRARSCTDWFCVLSCAPSVLQQRSGRLPVLTGRLPVTLVQLATNQPARVLHLTSKIMYLHCRSIGRAFCAGGVHQLGACSGPSVLTHRPHALTPRRHVQW